jgi:hypothetical protein
MEGLLHTVATSAESILGLVLLILGAVILARGRVNIGLSEEVAGLRARLLIGLGVTVVGVALWLLQVPD